MLRLIDDRFFSDPAFTGEGPMLDLDAIEAFEAPRRMSRDEGRAAAGPDWSRTHIPFDEETEND